MSTANRDAAQVKQAIEVYMRHAYEESPPPLTVSSMLSTLRSFAGDFFAAPTWVKDARVETKKYSLRLGNRHYPHMKLVYELSPDAKSYFFRADAHDAHCCPPEGAPEHAAFRELMETNQQIVTSIEQGWAADGIPTFKTFLRDDLARRRAEQASHG